MAGLTLRRLAAEYEAFASSPRSMRILLIANSVYAPVLPVIEIFVAAYILRRSHSPLEVILYQLVIYTAIPLGFAVNGWLLRKFAANRLYSAGMFLTGIALFLLMLPGRNSAAESVASAALLGAASGLFWANRGFLVLSETHDRERNYYYGVETSGITIASVAVPLAVAWLFAHVAGGAHAPADNRRAYALLAAASLVLSGLSAVVILRGKSALAPVRRLFFFRSHPLWRRMLRLAAFKAVIQGYLVTAPAILIFRFVGHEQMLGAMEAAGGCIAAACLYSIGRCSRPQHRIVVFAAGQFVFLLGAVCCCLLFNKVGVLIFMACLLAAKPLIDLGYFPIQFLATNHAVSLEGRGDYSYILSHECATFVGRFVGCGVFLGIAALFSSSAALRCTLPLIAVLELPSLLIARKLLRQIRDLHSLAAFR